MFAEYVFSTGFTTRPGALTGTRNFADGNGNNGQRPQLVVLNSKLYATWYESAGGVNQIRVAEWDGATSWNFVDGNSTSAGLNYTSSQHAYYPNFAVINSKIYVIWEESNGSYKQIRVKEWNGDSIWTFVDGGVGDGLNKNPNTDAFLPNISVFNSKLYTSWQESNGVNLNIRVKEWDGSTWRFVDGDVTDGINKDPAKTARASVLIEYNS